MQYRLWEGRGGGGGGEKQINQKVSYKGKGEKSKHKHHSTLNRWRRTLVSLGRVLEWETEQNFTTSCVLAYKGREVETHVLQRQPKTTDDWNELSQNGNQNRIKIAGNFSTPTKSC